MKLRIANKIIDNFDCENPRYRESTLERANRKWRRCRTGRETAAWFKQVSANYKRWKDDQERAMVRRLVRQALATQNAEGGSKQ